MLQAAAVGEAHARPRTRAHGPSIVQRPNDPPPMDNARRSSIVRRAERQQLVLPRRSRPTKAAAPSTLGPAIRR